MARKPGRPEKYEECVKPHLEQVAIWVSQGATDEEIADALGVSTSAIYTYKNKYPELKRAFARGRKAVVLDIRGALLKKAMGFAYEETRTNIREGATDEDPPKQYTEIYSRYCVPSETAAAMLLRNYDPNYRDRDKASTDLRERELDLKERIAEVNNWLDDETDETGGTADADTQSEVE